MVVNIDFYFLRLNSYCVILSHPLNRYLFLSGSDELGDLANGNGLALVAQGEATHLRVVLKALDTDSTGATNDLHASNDAVTTLGVCGRQLALTVGALLELVEKRCKGNLLNCRVHVEDTVETGRQNGLEIQDADLSLELGHAVNEALG